MEALETFERDGFTARLYLDFDPMSPDDWDQLGTLYHSSSFTFGERTSAPSRGWHVYARALSIFGEDVAAAVPVRIDDRGAQATIYATNLDNANGCIVTTHKRLTELCGDAPSYHTRDWAEQALREELETWKQYVEGDVYGYDVADPAGNLADSLWGLYGSEYAEEEAKRALADAIEAAHARRHAIAHGWALAHGLGTS